MTAKYVTPPPIPKPILSRTKNGKRIASVINRVYFDELQGYDLEESDPPTESFAAKLLGLGDRASEQAVEMLHGEFYANLLLSLANNNDSTVLFNRLAPNSLAHESHQMVWVNGLHCNKSLPGEEALIGNFNTKETDLMFGLDICQNKHLLFGLYGECGTSDMSQEKNTASVNTLGVGLYTLKVLNEAEEFSLRAALSYGRSHVQVNRNFCVADTMCKPKSNFDAHVAKAAAEIEKCLKVSRFDIAPFFGLQGGFVFNEEIAEDCGQDANLLLGKGNLGRIYGTLGVSFNYKADRLLILHSKVSVKTAIYGERCSTRACLPNVSDTLWFDVEGEKELYAAGLDLGLEYKIGYNTSLYLSGNVQGGSSTQYCANIGIGYKIPINSSTNSEDGF
jgi:outer membrane autotransporter protein